MKKKLRIFTALIMCALLSIGLFPLTGDSMAAPAVRYNSPAFVMSRVTAQSNVHAQQAQGMKSGGSSVSLPTGTVGSSNWAGYIDTPASGETYTSVSGTWKVPDISGSAENSAAAQWIGLGGVSTSDLLQMGTLEYVDNGKTTVEVFIEKLPDSAQNVTDVTAGETFSASISKISGTVWNLTYTVVSTDGKTVSNTLTESIDSAYAEEIGTSAEWISEEPSDSSGELYPLANMGTVTYSSALVNTAALSASANSVKPVALIDYNRVEISPSVVGSDGESFSTSMENESTGNDGTSSGSGSSSSGSTVTTPSYHGFDRNPGPAWYGHQGGWGSSGGGMPKSRRGRW